MSGVVQTLGTLQWLRRRHDALDSTETDAHFPSGHTCGHTAAGGPRGGAPGAEGRRCDRTVLHVLVRGLQRGGDI